MFSDIKHQLGQKHRHFLQSDKLAPGPGSFLLELIQAFEGISLAV